jgi:hypothetical protein
MPDVLYTVHYSSVTTGGLYDLDEYSSYKLVYNTVRNIAFEMRLICD